MSATFPLADLVVRIVGDMSQFSREMIRAEGLLKKKAAAFTQLEQRGVATFAVLSRAVGGFGAALATGLTVALGTMAALIGGLTAFTVWSQKVAIGADELRNRFKITFGQAAKQSEADLDSFADTVGRSRLELMDMAATLQNVFTAMGFTQGQSAKLSVTIAKLGTDIASFHDIADSDAVDRLSSALVGNHEALRSLGIVVTETAVKQQLLAMGFKRGFDSATDQEKILARLAIILRATSLMQNDAAKTAGSAANQFKGLWGIIKDIADAYGQAFTPALKIVLSAFREMLISVRSNMGGLQQFSMTLAGFATTAISIFKDLVFVIGNYDLAWEALKIQAMESSESTIQTLLWFGDSVEAIWNYMVENTKVAFNNLGRIIQATFLGMELQFKVIYNIIANVVGGIIGIIAQLEEALHSMAVAAAESLLPLSSAALPDNKEYVASLRAIQAVIKNSKFKDGLPDFSRINPAQDYKNLKTVNPQGKIFSDLEERKKKLEEEMSRRLAAVPAAEQQEKPQFQAPDLQKLFDGLMGPNASAKVKVSLSDSLSAWKENLMDAFNDTDIQKQTKLQADIEANQKAQMGQDKQMHSETLKALSYVGGGFY